MTLKHRYLAVSLIFLLALTACSYADYREKTYKLEYNGKTEKVRAILTKPAFFRGAERLPFMGRSFTPDEYRHSSHVVIFTQIGWEVRLQANIAVLGKNVKVNGDDFLVIGIMAPSVDFPEGAEFARPD